MAKLPKGWGTIIWKDKQGQKFSNNFPKTMVPDMAKAINKKGKVTKLVLGEDY